MALAFALLAFASIPAVAAANVAPQCDAGLASMNIRTGKAAKVRVYCSDADSDPLTISHSSPDHGTLGAFSLNAGANAYEATFTPAASYTGPDDFNFTASDGTATTPTYGFNLIITENHAPQCEPNGTVHTKVDQAIVLSVFCADADEQDQNLTYSAVAGQGPSHGSLGPVANSEVEYTPTNGYSGADQFTIRASDGDLAGTYSQAIHVADTPLCTPPPAVQVRSGAARWLTVECTRPVDDTGVARYQIGTQPTQGTISPSGQTTSDQRFYEADPSASGADSYTVRMTSSSGVSPYVTQAITTGPSINHAPVCDESTFDRQTVFADRRATLEIACTDLDDDALTYAPAAEPEHGRTTTSDGQVVYSADEGYLGWDDVPFAVDDGHGGSTNANFPVNVHPSEPPTCVQGEIAKTVRPGKSVRLELACVNPQGDPQTYSATAPSKGTLGTFDSAGAVTYTANAGASGTDTFTFRAANRAGETDPQPVAVTIDSSFNRAPECNANPFTPKRAVGNLANTLDLGAFCTDPDGDALVYERRSTPGHGSVTAGPAATLSYTPANGYLGPDSFDYVARDDRGTESAVTTLSLDVVASNAPTCAAGGPITVRPGQVKTFFFNCSDPDFQPITYRIVTPPSGTLSPPGDSTSPFRTYTAPATAGPDSFTYKAVSAGGESALRTQQITVDPDHNATPSCTPNSAAPDTVVQNRASTLPIATWCEDADGDTLEFTRAVPDPEHGTATASNGMITYTSDPGYTGPDTFGYEADDGHGGTVSSTYVVEVVEPVAPNCETPGSVSVRPAAHRTVELQCFDNFGDALNFEITDAPDLGTLDPAGDGPEQVRSYLAGASEGDDAFSYRASNANGIGNVVTQALHLDPDANQPPSCTGNAAFPQAVAAAETSTLHPDCTDDDGDALTYAKLTEPAHGTLSDTAGVLDYTPNPGYSGPDEFDYKASDGHGGDSALVTHHVDVVALGPPTCALSDPISLRPNASASVFFDCHDAVGGTLTYVIDSPPARGDLQGSGASRTFSAGSQEGDATFTWHAHSDESGDSPTQTQAITIDAGANTPPSCLTSITVAAEAGIEQVVDPACSDPEDDSLSYAKQSDPAHGTLTDSGGVLRYTAAGGYSGIDSFTYRASDGHGGQSGVGTVTLNVTHTNHAPTCTGGPFAYDVESDAVLDIPAPSCTDEDGETLSYEVVTPPGHGSLGDADPDGGRTYTSDPGYTGADSFTFRAWDGLDHSSLQTVNITVDPRPNGAPQCADITSRAAPGDATVVQLGCTDPDGDPITLELVGAPAHGTLGGIDQGTDRVVYTSESDYTGVDSFTYRATDGTHTGPEATVDVTVTGAPACEDVARTTEIDTPVSVPLTCTDPDGDSLTLSIATGPAKGTLNALSGASVTYTPNAGAFGADSFTYRASDGTAQSAPATASITITRPPSCEDVSVRTKVGTAVPVPLECADADGDPLTLSIVDGPSKGSLGPISGGLVTYTPDPGASGSDTFRFRGTDGTVTSVPATATIAISRAPSCEDVSRTTAAGDPVTVPLTCTDPDGDALTLSIVGGPSKGSLGSISGDQVTYTPDAGEFGADSFTYLASDGLAQSAPATVSITITRPPSCDDVSRTTAAGGSVSVPLSCTDPDGDSLTLSIVGGPAKGSLGAISGGAVTYTPGAGQFGSDSFTFRAADGTAQSSPATASVAITRAPSCDDAARTTAVGNPVSVPLTCTDPDGDDVTLSIVDAPAHGSLGSISGGAVTYTPDAGYFGSDSFTFTASDGVAESAPAEASMTVTRAPGCDDVSRTTAAGGSVSVPLSCTDPDGDSLTLSIVDAPLKGSLGSISGGSVTYTADDGEFGADSFTYRASDGTAVSAPATVAITITRRPTCDDVSVKTAVGSAVQVPLTCSDPDGDAVTLSIVDGPSKGSLGSISGGEVSYTPDAGEHGADSFTYRASDGTATSAAATASIAVTRPPSCDDVSVRTAVGTAVQVPLDCTDADGDSLALSIVDGPAKGSLGSITGNTVVYTPDAGEFGADSFTYRAGDGTAESGEATADITITRPPSCLDVGETVLVGSSVSVPLTCSDPEGDSLTLSIADGPSHGSLGAISGDSVTYTPDEDAVGEDSFTFTASDGAAVSAPATATITVTGKPHCSDVSRTTAVGEAVTVPLSCTDPDGDPLALSIVDGPAKGSLGAISGDEVTYTPDAGEYGADSFTYRANDGTADSPPATVDITITRAPSCEDVSVKTAVGAAVDVPLDCTDPDGDTLTLSKRTDPAKGSLGAVSGSMITYTPDAGEFGADSFTYGAGDGTAASAPAAVDVTITRPPSCDDVSRTTAVGKPVSVPLSCTDPDGDDVTLSIVDGPSKGSLGSISGGEVTYTPDAGEFGADAFTYGATDGTADSAPAAVSITITRPPSCDDVSVRTEVGSAVQVPLTCTDPEDDPVTLSIVDGPSKGTLGAIGGGEVTYTPDAGEFGADTFTYRGNDGVGNSAAATAHVTITRPPSCEDVAVKTGVGTAVQVPLDCTDPDGDTLTLSTLTGPAKGSLGAVSGGRVLYTPDAGEFGADSFTYGATDGTADADPATVDVTITRPPACEDVEETVRIGSSVSVPLTCSDPDDDDLTLSTATEPSQGTLGAVSGTSVSYTPDADALGEDTFTYTASDSTAESAPATATISITGPPRCDDVSVRTRVATPVQVPLTCVDPDGADLTLATADAPTKGTLGAISGGEVTYTPAAGEHGADSFTYTANDGEDDSTPATASITITRAPSCDDATAKTAAGEPVSVPLSCTDADGGTLTLAKAGDPAKGTLGAFTASSVTYTPDAGEHGDDSFTYTADDGDGKSGPATVSITITRPPDCDPVSAETPAGTPVEVTLSCTDPDGDDVTLAKGAGPSHGSLGAIADGKVTYTPDDGYSGADSFTYRGSDGIATSAPATVSLTVLPPPNQAPTCEPVSAATTTGSAVEVQLDCADPDDDPLDLEAVDAPEHGSLGAVSGGKVTYTPDAGYHGPDTFTYRASDGDLESSPATVTLAVQAPPEVSLAVDKASAVEGSTLVFSATGSDADGTIGEYRYAVDGTVVQTGKTRTLFRRFDALGSHTVTVRAKDDDGQTATASKTVTITKKPAPPSKPGGAGGPDSPSGPSGGGGGSGGGGPAPDTSPPAASLKAAKQKLKAVLAKGLALTASCSEPCTLKLQLVVDKKTAKKLKLGKKPMVIGTMTRSIAGSTKLKIKLTGKAKKKLKKAKKLKLGVRAVATDAAGNAATRAMTVTLKR